MKLSNLIPILKEETFTATNKSTGKTSVFKSKEHRDDAIKAGTHAAIKTSNDAPTASVAGTSVFGGDVASKKQPSVSLKASKSNVMSNKSADSVQSILNKQLGGNGIAQVTDEGVIEYTIPDKNGITNTSLYIGKDEDGYNVSIEAEAGDDIEFDNDAYQSFDNPKDAMDYAVKIATKYKKELGGV
jgi:hypothetical protein